MNSWGFLLLIQTQTTFKIKQAYFVICWLLSTYQKLSIEAETKTLFHTITSEICKTRKWTENIPILWQLWPLSTRKKTSHYLFFLKQLLQKAQQQQKNPPKLHSASNTFFFFFRTGKNSTFFFFFFWGTQKRTENKGDCNLSTSCMRLGRFFFPALLLL